MAQKKKAAAKRQKQQQKKQQRRNARLQKRRSVQTARVQPYPLEMKDDSFAAPTDMTLLNDLRSIFPGGDPSNSSPDDFANTLLPIAWDSADLIDEPEFAEIAIPPLEASIAYAKALQESGMEPDEIFDLDEDERDEAIGEALDEATFRLLTPERFDQLHQGLIKLRARLKHENQPNEVPRVAAAQLFFEMDKSRRLVASLGLVQELVRRSIAVGFDVAKILNKVRSQTGDDQSLSSEQLRERILQSGLAGDIQQMVEGRPDLQRFLVEQGEEMRDAGRRALFEGKLKLGLFTDDELAQALALFKQATDGDLTLFASFDDQLDLVMQELAPQLIEYIRGLLVAEERITELRQRIAAVMADPSIADSEWTAFLMALHDDLMEEDGVSYALSSLLSALFGELWPRILPSANVEAGEETDPL
jgi:hypothetical protein